MKRARGSQHYNLEVGGRVEKERDGQRWGRGDGEVEEKQWQSGKRKEGNRHRKATQRRNKAEIHEVKWKV